MSFKHILTAALIAFLAGNTVASAEPYRIVGFGDSLMAGFGLGPGESFPEQLEAKLKAAGHDVVIENAGVSGDTTAGGLARLNWSVADGTELVILELGANDMLRGVPPEITEKNLDQMIGALKQRGIGVLLAGMLAAFNSIYPRLAAKHDVPLYPFFMDGVAADPNFLLQDLMHPNAAGVGRIVDRVLPTVEGLLAAAPQGT
jgi:acyl-CoA thioesterase I